MASREVINYATEAVRADKEGRKQRAIDMYCKCAEALMNDCHTNPTLSERQINGFKARANQYLKRAEELKLLLQQERTPPPQPPSNNSNNDDWGDLGIFSSNAQSAGVESGLSSSLGGGAAGGVSWGATSTNTRGPGEEKKAQLRVPPPQPPSNTSNNDDDWGDLDMFSSNNPSQSAGVESGLYSSLGGGIPGGDGGVGGGWGNDNGFGEHEDDAFERAKKAALFAQKNPEIARQGMAALQTSNEKLVKANEQFTAAGGFKKVMAVGGAGAAAGVAAGALVVGAPILLGVGGLAGGIYAATRKGETGRRAHAAGEAFSSGVSTASEINKEYKITETGWNMTKRGVNGAIDLNKKHDITGKTAAVGGVLWNGTKKAASATMEFNERHDVTGKVAKVGGTIWDGTKQAVSGTIEFNRRHRVTEKIGNAAEEVWDGVSSLWKK
eukprot:g999.t1